MGVRLAGLKPGCQAQAEFADEAMSDTDSIARLGRAVAVTLVAATQRSTQKAMGQDPVRSQMDTRICFGVREREDTGLVLGQEMLNTGWRAHTLNAPGKFLVSGRVGSSTASRSRVVSANRPSSRRYLTRIQPSRDLRPK